MEIILSGIRLWFMYQNVQTGLVIAKVIFKYGSPKVRKLLFVLLKRGFLITYRAILSKKQKANQFTLIESGITANGDQIYNTKDIEIQINNRIPSPLPELPPESDGDSSNSSSISDYT